MVKDNFKYDHGKPQAALILSEFARALIEISKLGTFGLKKYPNNDWQKTTNGINRFSDALMRHQLTEMSGIKSDEESNFLHATHIAWNALARLELILIDQENQK